jgi:hypothetical protein
VVLERAVARAACRVSLHFLAACGSLPRAGDVDGNRETNNRNLVSMTLRRRRYHLLLLGEHGDKHKRGGLQA